MTLAALASTPARACAPSARRASASRRRAFPSTRPASRLRASDDRISTPSGASSLDALDRVLASADASDAQETAFSHAPARLDPFADPTPEDLRRAASERDATSSGSRSFEGRRGGADRDSMAELLDVRARFQGGAALLRAMTSSDVFAQTLEDVTVGQLAVVGEDYPSLLLWKNQHYEVRRIYFQRSDDEVGAKRVDAATLGEDYPDGGEDVADAVRRVVLRGATTARPCACVPSASGCEPSARKSSTRCSSPFRCRSSGRRGFLVRRLRRKLTTIFENL